LEAIVGGGSRAELGGVEGLPLAAGAQDKEDGVHTHPVGGAWPTAAKAVGIHMAGKVHLNFRPQVIGDTPIVGNRILVHCSTGERPQLQENTGSCTQLL
jgi:hypothetical protein